MLDMVMVCRDREEDTRRSLVSLQRHPPLPDGWTLTIVEDGSSEPYLERLMEEFEFPDVQILVNKESMGVGGAKNYGIAMAEKNFLLNRIGFSRHLLYLSDNDVYFVPGWAETLLLTYPVAYDMGVRILGGRNHPYNQPEEDLSASIKVYSALGGISWCLHWSVWETYGPFDSNAKGVRQSEDWAFCQRVRKDGFKVGTIWPWRVVDCGVLDTFGTRVPGAEMMGLQNVNTSRLKEDEIEMLERLFR